MFLKMNMKYIPPGFCLIQDTSQNDFDYNVQIPPSIQPAELPEFVSAKLFVQNIVP